MPSDRIRPLALALILDGPRTLVEEGYDEVKDKSYFRLIGGGIEFGETGEQAMRRELREEIGAEASFVEYLETLENLFVYGGAPGHELCRVYRVELADERLYELDELERLDRATGGERTQWAEVERFLIRREPLYPDGAVELLERVLPG